MKVDNEKLSALIDNEYIDDPLFDELIADEQQQTQFSRYHLIGDVMRGEVGGPLLTEEFSQNVMAEIAGKSIPTLVTKVKADTHLPNDSSPKKDNVISFAKRFGQYAIAASVAGVVVMTSLISAPTDVENNNTGIEVLNTVPFGGATTPVSLEAQQSQSKDMIKKRNERLEALLKDHQLQLQTQP